jgi:hypothetical protein
MEQGVIRNIIVSKDIKGLLGEVSGTQVVVSCLLPRTLPNGKKQHWIKNPTLDIVVISEEFYEELRRLVDA